MSLWLCAAVLAGLLPDATLNKAWMVRLLNVAFVAGPVVTLVGVALGWLGRKTWRGRFGLVVCLLVLVVMGSLIVGGHSASGRWPWFRPVKVNDSCGCG